MKKISKMHELFGERSGTCGDCSNLLRIVTRKGSCSKCSVYGVTDGSESDWDRGYTACGMKDRFFGMFPIIKTFEQEQ